MKVAGRRQRRLSDAALQFSCLRVAGLDADGFDNTLRQQRWLLHVVFVFFYHSPNSGFINGILC